MAGTSWLVDKCRIATKIKSASGASGKTIWKSNPTRVCPNCQHVIDNSDVSQEWPGLPKGVKFDPTDQEIIWHLLAKVGAGNSKPHPFIDEFITTLEVDDGICYTHPQHLPGVRQDGSASHFFHREIKAYNTGSRKRRKIHDQDFGGVRWHKTGRTKPVMLNGVQKGCKKIMVLYMNLVRGGKAEKTNWIIHQYHLGTENDEKDGEYVISKVFYQQQQVKVEEKDDQDIPESTETPIVKVDLVTPKIVTLEPPRNEKRCSDLDQGEDFVQIPQGVSLNENVTILENTEKPIVKVDPNTPKIVTPELPRNEKRCSDIDQGEESVQIHQLLQSEWFDDIDPDCEELTKHDLSVAETGQNNEGIDSTENNADCEELTKHDLSVAETGQNNEGMDNTENNADCEELTKHNLSVVETGQNNEGMDNTENNAAEDSKWWDSESQNMLDSQQLAEALSFCDDLLQSQTPKKDGENEKQKERPSLSVYARLGPELLKKDIEECQNLVLDTANVELDTPPSEFRLSQLEFSSQDSFVSWGGSKVIN